MKYIPITKPVIGKEEIDAVNKVLKSGQLAQGPMVALLEKRVAQFCKVSHAIAVTNGTAALYLALKVLNLQKGDEVITTPLSFVATANVILLNNAKVVFADIDPKTFNLDPDAVEQKISNKTKAILAVDLYGQPFNYLKLSAIASKYKLHLIEDACQAIGAQIQKRKTGTLGDMSCFSLYATKNITSGEGGIITTNNSDFAKQLVLLRQHGQSEPSHPRARDFSRLSEAKPRTAPTSCRGWCWGKSSSYNYQTLGFNFRLTDIQATLALTQLKKIKIFTKKRVKRAEFLTKHLSKIPGIAPPFVLPNTVHVFHLYTIRVAPKFGLSLNQLKNYLQKRGVDVRIYYPQPLHFLPYLKEMGYNYKEGDFPVAEKACEEILSLPVHPLVKKSELEYIVKMIKKAANGKKLTTDKNTSEESRRNTSEVAGTDSSEVICTKGCK